MNDCVFCQILKGDLPASYVYQDAICTVFMDIQPVNPGHLLVIPNKHVAYLEELDGPTGGHLFQIGQNIAGALRESDVHCEGVNLLLADGIAAGQEVFHVHLHVIPRFRNDGFGFKFSQDYHKLPDRSELDEIAEKIRGKI